MTPSKSFGVALVWTLTLLATACGGEGTFTPSGVGGSSGADITGTVTEMPAQRNLSASALAATATIPVTVSVVGTNISTTIDSSRRFHLTGVPTGDVQLKFAGSGLDATLTLKGVEAGDRIDIKVKLTDSSVRIEAETREHGKDDDDKDDEDEGEVKGLVSNRSGSCPTLTFNLGSTTVKTNGSTKFEDGSCSGIANGVHLAVEGHRQSDGSLLATDVEFED